MRHIDFKDWIALFYFTIDDFVCSKYVNTENKFTRNRILTQRDITLYAFVQKGRTNAVEAYEFCKFLKGNVFKLVTRQAIAKQRKFLKPKLYLDMNKKFIDKIYENTKDLKKTHGYLILSCDGSILKLPNDNKTKKEFRIKLDSLLKRFLARARISCIVDSHSQLILDIILSNKNVPEVELAIKSIKNLSKRINLKKAIITYDRGYNSIELILQSIKHETFFLIRGRTSIFEKEILKMRTDDEIIQIPLNQKRISRIKDPEILKMIKNQTHLKIRITKVKLETGQTEILISNIPQKEFTSNDLKKLYALRWKIETVYDFLKNVVNIENFTGRSKIIIEQDFYSKIVLYNTSMAMKLYMEEKIKQEHKMNKETAINFNVTTGIIKTEINNILKADKIDKIKEILEMASKGLKNQIIKINRTMRKDMEIKYPDKTNKFSINKRKSLL